MPSIARGARLALTAFVLSLLVVSSFMNGIRLRPALAAEAAPALDLPAIALSPDDVVEAGLDGFGIAVVGPQSSGWQSIGDVAGQTVLAGGVSDFITLAPLNDELARDGWQRQYRRLLAQPGADDPTSVNMWVSSEVSEYADADGADAALTALTANGRVLPPTGDPIGDRVEIRRNMVAISGSELDFTFRSGNLLGTVRLAQFQGDTEPPLGPAYILARRLAKRMEAAQADPQPGLDAVALDVSLPASPAETETYWRYDGETFRDFNETDDSLANASAGFDPAVAVYQKLYRPVAADQPILPELSIRLLRFADKDAAGTWLEELPALLATDVQNSDGSFTIDPIDDLGTIGDESQAYAVTQERYGSPTMGYRFYVRVGADIARMQFDATWAPDLEAVEELVGDQAGCLSAGACIEPVALPAALNEVLCPTAAADGLVGSAISKLTSPKVDWRITRAGSTGAVPAADSGIVFVDEAALDPGGSDLHTLRAVDAATGEQRWCTVTGEIPTTLTAANGLVYTIAEAVIGGHWQADLVALSAETGLEQWAFPIGMTVDGHAPGVTVADDVVYLSTQMGAVEALDAKTGQPRWLFVADPTDNFEDQFLTVPAVSSDTAFVTGGGILYAIDAKTGEARWSAQPGDGDVLGSPQTAGDIVYTAGKHGVYALDVTTGDTVWSYDADLGGPADLTSANGSIFVTSTAAEADQPTTLYALDATTGDLIWQLAGDGTLSSPTVDGDAVYVADAGSGLLARSIADGSELWHAPLQNGVSVLTAADGRLVVATSLNGGGMAVTGYAGEDAVASLRHDPKG